jgi:site-specific DNA recombinase
VADHIAEIITSGTHNQIKALVEALVAKVTITASDRLTPVFRIPQPRDNDGAATALPAEATPTGMVRTMTKSVEVPGIEPGSSVASPGLLRAQSATSLLGPTGLAN